MKQDVLGLLMSAMLLGGCVSPDSTRDIPSVTDFEAERYLGTWYEVARMPHRFEEGMSEVYAIYSPLPDDEIQVINSGVRDGKRRSIKGVARFRAAHDIGELEVSFFRPFYGGYRIILLEPDYSSAVVTSDTKNYLWILSRTTTLPEARITAYLTQLQSWGFDVDRLEFPAPATEAVAAP